MYEKRKKEAKRQDVGHDDPGVPYREATQTQNITIKTSSNKTKKVLQIKNKPKGFCFAARPVVVPYEPPYVCVFP